MNRQGVESSHAPAKSGNGVGSARPGRDHCHSEMIGGLGVVLSGNRRRLLVVIADVLQLLAACQRIVQVHGTAADQQEDVLDALLGYKADYIIGQVSFGWLALVRRLCGRGFGKNHLNQFAHRAIAARGGSYKTALGADAWLGIGRRGGQARDLPAPAGR